jgi:hypothetical protein
MDLGDGGPDGGALLPVSVAKVFGRLRREFLGLAVVSWAVHLHSSCLVVRYWSDTAAEGGYAEARPAGDRAQYEYSGSGDKYATWVAYPAVLRSVGELDAGEVDAVAYLVRLVPDLLGGYGR